MKRVVRASLKVLLVLLLAAVAFVAYCYQAVGRRVDRVWTVTTPALDVPVSTDAALVERGKYLVTRVAGCVDCHEPDLGGRLLVDETLAGRLAAPNLTRGRGGIASRYADEDLIRVLVHGVKKDGHSVIYMPSQDMHFSARDAAAIVSYLRAAPPVDREWPSPRVGPASRVLTALGQLPLLPAEFIDHEHAQFAAAIDTSDPVRAGQQLVAASGCIGCHGPTFEGGGGPPPGAANITPAGIGDWTERDFVTALRDHKRPNGTTIAEAMPRAFGSMVDEDLRRIFAFLRTLPARGQKSKNQLKAG